MPADSRFLARRRGTPRRGRREVRSDRGIADDPGCRYLDTETTGRAIGIPVCNLTRRLT
jgi:hypothetical protein